MVPIDSLNSGSSHKLVFSIGINDPHIGFFSHVKGTDVFSDSVTGLRNEPDFQVPVDLGVVEPADVQVGDVLLGYGDELEVGSGKDLNWM